MGENDCRGGARAFQNQEMAGFAVGQIIKVMSGSRPNNRGGSGGVDNRAPGCLESWQSDGLLQSLNRPNHAVRHVQRLRVRQCQASTISCLTNGLVLCLSP